MDIDLTNVNRTNINRTNIERTDADREIVPKIRRLRPSAFSAV
jgi:hypothetical protein